MVVWWLKSSLDEQEKKDRIGERVAALQQLVSPFGKVLYYFPKV
jgi:hypothetical protein